MLRNPRFILFAISTAFVGGTVGVERSVLAVFGQDRFGIASKAIISSFLIAFGTAKALANLGSGPLADRVGRVNLLRLGWLICLPVPGLIWMADAWWVVIAANVLLGVSQGICWSIGLVGMISVASDSKRGAAAGINEFSGYAAAAAAAMAAGLFTDAALGPSVDGSAFLIMQALVFGGLITSLLTKRKTTHVKREPQPLAMLMRSAFNDGQMRSACFGGMATNMTDALAWALLPVIALSRGVSLAKVGLLAASYPAVWAVAQLVTGTASDRFGRRNLIVGGLMLQAIACAALAPMKTFGGMLASMVVLGVGTAMAYPTLVAAVADRFGTSHRPTAIGVYRLFRDAGYVTGALIAGAMADAFGTSAAVLAVAGLSALASLAAAQALPSAKDSAVPV